MQVSFVTESRNLEAKAFESRSISVLHLGSFTPYRNTFWRHWVGTNKKEIKIGDFFQSLCPPMTIWKDYLKNLNMSKPPNWNKSLWELVNNNTLWNEDFIVWMTAEAFPNFQKLYRNVHYREGEGI